MGTNRTVSGAAYSGIMIPQPITEEHVTSTLGTDYGLADPVVGPPSVSATTVLQLEATGDLDDEATYYTVQVVRAGQVATGAEAPGGYTYGVSTGTPNMLHEMPSVLTGYIGINGNACDQPTAVALDDGSIVVVDNDSAAVTCEYRTADGTYTDVLIHSGVVPAGLCLAPDGALHVYVLDDALFCYRSEDGGATWSLQHSDGIPAPPASPTSVRAERDAQGQIVLFVYESGDTTQYVSSDGGFQFREVTTATNTLVWDVRLVGGVLLAVTGEADGGDGATYVRRFAAAHVSAFVGTATLITSTGDAHRTWQASCLVAVPWGPIYLLHDTGSGGIEGYTSLDHGLTWASAVGAPELTVSGSATARWGFPTAVWSRGGLSVIVNDAGGQAAVTPTMLVELRFGGRSTMPATADLARSAFKQWDDTFLPIDTLADNDWSTSDTGTVARTVSYATGERIITDAAEAASSTKDTGTAATRSVGWWIVKPVTGVLSLHLTTDNGAIQIDVKTDGIRVYDPNLSAPSYTAITVSDYIEVLAGMDNATDGTAWYRLHTSGTVKNEKTFTEIGTVGTITVDASTSVTHGVSLGASSEAFVLACGVHAYEAGPSALGLGELSAADKERCAIPLLSTFDWLSGDVSLRLVSGTPRRDGVVHTFRATSARPLRNMFPARSPSYRRVWRSDLAGGTDTMSITLPRKIGARGQPVGLYLDGMYGIASAFIQANGSGAMETSSTILEFTYEAIGTGSICGYGSGTVASIGYVRRDQLVGWGFVDSSGDFYEITGNTEGVLTSGDTTTNRAIRTVENDGVDGGAGYLCPPRLLLVWWPNNDAQINTIRLDFTSLGNPAYREVGVCAFGEIQLFPITPDLNESLILDDDARVSTSDDGSREDSRRHRDRRRLQVAWVGSPHSVHQANTSTSPDYVAPMTGIPSLTWDALPHIVRGTVEAAKGKPVVWVPSLVEAGNVENISETIFPLGADSDVLFGRITGGFRLEGIQYVGSRSTSQMWRVPAITIEEEL